MEKIIFTDSRAIKITNDMRRALDSYNEKKVILESANEDLKALEDSRKEKEYELEGLNIKALDSDKKIAKEASKKIKTIDKEISKIINDAKKTAEKVSMLEEQNSPVYVTGVALKPFSDFNKEEVPVDNNLPEIDNMDMPVEETNSVNDIQVIDNSAFIPNDDVPSVTEVNSNEEIEPTDDSLEATSLNDMPVVEPIVLDDISDSEDIVVNSDESKETRSSDLETELGEVPMEEKTDDMVSEKVINNFLSEGDLDKMWDALNNDSSDDIKEEAKDNIEPDEGVIEQSSDDVAEESKNDGKPEIQKPDIFGDDSEFAKIADKVVAPSPLIPEGNVTDLVPYSDYNDYVFKFGQDHYGKEALTPKEISDLADVKDFLDDDTFELERSKQYNNTMKENDELRDRITKLDADYKSQIDEMKNEHTSNLDELGKLIDKANGIISDNRTEISNLKNKNKDLNNTVNNQKDKIDSLNTKKSELEETIDKLNADIMELERIKEEHETKIKNYEDKFKEVLGIVREVKVDN